MTIETSTQRKGPSGGNVTEWSFFAEAWAGLNDRPGGRRAATRAGGGEYVAGAYEVTIGYRPDLPRRIRLVLKDGRVLTVNDVHNPRQRNQVLVLDCIDGQRGNS